MMRHYEESALIRATLQEVFDYVDDHARFSSHMSEGSWMMGGGRMRVDLDEGGGQRLGSHIRLSGRVFGINLFLDEVVIERNPPRKKVWETVGNPRLLVIGQYRMGWLIDENKEGSLLKVFIDYDLPKTRGGRWLGTLFGGLYPRWCVRQMINGVQAEFKKSISKKKETIP